MSRAVVAADVWVGGRAPQVGGGFSGGWGPIIQGPGGAYGGEGGEYGGDGGGYSGGDEGSDGGRVVDPGDRGARFVRGVVGALGDPRYRRYATARPTTQLDLLFGGYLVGTLGLLTGGMVGVAGGTTLGWGARH